MKKIMTTLAMTSVIGLTACGEKDTREDHIFTVEVEVTDTKGNVQKVNKDCKQLSSVCSASFDLGEGSNKRTFLVTANNKAVHGDELYKKAMLVSSKEEEDRIIDSEYRQNITISGGGFNQYDKKTAFTNVKFPENKWVPKTERVLNHELIIPNPELNEKIEELQEKRKIKYAERRKIDRDLAFGKLNKEDKIKRIKDFKKSNEEWKNLGKQLTALSMPDVKVADLKIRIY